jgi:hypothetical protein
VILKQAYAGTVHRGGGFQGAPVFIKRSQALERGKASTRLPSPVLPAH